MALITAAAEEVDSIRFSSTDPFRSARLARVILPEVLSTARVFDTESPRTVELLNEAVDTIAAGVSAYWPMIGAMSSAPLVREVDSRGLDELQASDIAAGWAREMLETGDVEVLGSKFERVWVNGRRIQ